jgi:hypothetical protein
MRVNTMEDDSVFEEEGEERDSFVQPARGLRSFALVSWLFIRTWKLSLHHHAVLYCGSGMFIPIFLSRSRIRIKELKYFNPKIVSKLSEI